MSFRLDQTCGACPEQYDVFDEETGEKVGYFRLRHGCFTAEYPDCGGEAVYSANTNGDGCFTDDERDYHLSRALEAIRLKHLGV